MTEEMKGNGKKESGCLSSIFGTIFWLTLTFGGFYLLHNWQMRASVQLRQEGNQMVASDLNRIITMANDLSQLDITQTGNTYKALFTFYKQQANGGIISSSTETLEQDAQPIGGGVFKIYTAPTEYILGFPFAKWYHHNIIAPQLPEFSFLLVTPYSIEFCTTTGNCKEVKKTADFGNENTKFTYYF